MPPHLADGRMFECMSLDKDYVTKSAMLVVFRKTSDSNKVQEESVGLRGVEGRFLGR